MRDGCGAETAVGGVEGEDGVVEGYDVVGEDEGDEGEDEGYDKEDVIEAGELFLVVVDRTREEAVLRTVLVTADRYEVTVVVEVGDGVRLAPAVTV